MKSIKIIKRLMSMLLVFALLFGLIPMGDNDAFAAEGDYSLQVEKSADKDFFSKVGETITYTYEITNTGTEAIDLLNKTGAEAFTLEDDKIGTIAINSELTQLDPNESLTVKAEYIVTQEDLDVNFITNVVTASAIVGNNNFSDSATLTVALANPRLEVEKSADKANFSVLGETIIYTYKVTNTGNVPIQGVSGATIEPFLLEDNKIGIIDTSSKPKELEAGESFTVTAEYKVTQNDIDEKVVYNIVNVTGSYNGSIVDGEADLTLYWIEEEPNPELTLTKTSNKRSFSEVGEIITYTYELKNIGNVTLYGLSDPTQASYFTLVDDKIGNIDLSSQPKSLTTGASFSVSEQYTVTQVDKEAGFVTNVATASGIHMNTEVVAVDTCTVLLKKKESSSGGGSQVTSVVEEKLNTRDRIQYLTGYPDNTVKPEAFITREEVSAVFYRLLTPEYRESIYTTGQTFIDVSAGRWSEKHIATLAKGNIIQGYTDGKFKPGDNITRAELATIASRFDNLSPFTSNKFSDIEGHWANSYINSASEKGWVNGYEDGTFKPDQYITRAEFVTLVNNVLNRKVKKENILPTARQFLDLSNNKWYYEAMQGAINSYNYTREKDDDYEIWTEIIYPKLEM